MGEGAMGKGGDSATMKSRSRGHPTSLSIDPGFVHPHMSKHEIAFPDLLSELATVREKRGFDVKDWCAKKITMFNDYMRRCGLKACAVSVSGGIDSSVVLALCMAAKKQEGSPIERVIAVAQPIFSTPAIQNRAYNVSKALGAEVVTVDQSDLHTSLSSLVDKAVGITGESFAKGQLRSYMRSPVIYYSAQLLSQSGTPCIVMGTGNYDEDGYLMYFCKAGDGVVDVQLIADLHKSEVFRVGAELGVPNSSWAAYPPSADLWEGQTDEDELGMSYDFVELYTHYLAMSDTEKQEFKNRLTPEALEYFIATGIKADSTHRRNCHKANSPLNLNVMALPFTFSG